MAFTNATTRAEAIDLAASLNRYLAEIQVILSQNKLEDISGKLTWIVRALSQFARDNKLNAAELAKVDQIKTKAEAFKASLGTMSPKSRKAVIDLLEREIKNLVR